MKTLIIFMIFLINNVLANTNTKPCNITDLSNNLSSNKDTKSCIKSFNLSSNSNRNILNLAFNGNDSKIFFKKTDCVSFMSSFLNYMYIKDCNINGYTSIDYKTYINAAFNIDIKLTNISLNPIASLMPLLNNTQTNTTLSPTMIPTKVPTNTTISPTKVPTNTTINPTEVPTNTTINPSTNTTIDEPDRMPKLPEIDNSTISKSNTSKIFKKLYTFQVIIISIILMNMI